MNQDGKKRRVNKRAVQEIPWQVAVGCTEQGEASAQTAEACRATANRYGIGRRFVLHEFLQGQNIFSVLILIFYRIHQTLDHEDPEPADPAFLRREGSIRLSIFQRIIGFAGIEKFDCDLRLC